MPLPHAERSVLYRGAHVIDELLREHLIRPNEIETPRPIALHTLRHIHTDAYLEQVSHSNGELLAHILGTKPDELDVDQILLSQRWAVGGTVAGAQSLITSSRSIALNLGGGFHHAEPERGSGFCVYNDIAVAISVLRSQGFASPIAIVDLDFHQGDGNLTCFANDPSVFTFSIHGVVWARVEAQANCDLLLPSGTDDRHYLSALKSSLPHHLEQHRPALVFYLAGNDVLKGDPLGDFSLTIGGVFERDRFVVETLRTLRTKIMITLGGGYQPHSWLCTANLARWLLTQENSFRSVVETTAHKARYATIARTLNPTRLSTDNSDLSLNFTLDEIMGDLTPQRQSHRFLDYYSRSGLEYALERYGLFARIHEFGFFDFRLELDLQGRDKHVLRIYGAHFSTPQIHHLLIELAVRRLALPEFPSLTFLAIEWLLLQNPVASFSLARPPLPGQKHPGLGVATDVMALLKQVCLRLGLCGIVFRPAHYHIAAVTPSEFQFLDPQEQGRFQALKRALSSWPIVEASQAIDEKKLILDDRTPVGWSANWFCMPISHELLRHFSSDAYRKAVSQAEATCLFKIAHMPSFIP